MPREEVFGRREAEGMASEEEPASSEGEGMPLEAELARPEILFGWRVEKGMEPGERGMPREGLSGWREDFFG
jgi:hypothetical protein